MNIKWQAGVPAPVEGAHQTAVFLDGKVYIGGGDGSSDVIDIYTPANNSWSSSPINTPYQHFSMTTLNSQLITAGGQDRSDFIVTNKIFLLHGDQLKEYARMITPRRKATAAGYQGTLIIAGGRNDQNKILATTELFDSASGQWYSVSDLPSPHFDLKSVIVNNVLYLLGGASNERMYSNEVFTASLDTLSSNQLKWRSQQCTPRHSTAPISIQGRHLLILGGYMNRNIYMLKKVMINYSWKVIERIPSPRRSPGAVCVEDNKIIVIGGMDDKGLYTNTVWIGSCEPQ